MADERLTDSIETRAALRKELKAKMNELAVFAASLDTICHGAAKDVNNARSSLFAAWSKLRAEPLD